MASPAAHINHAPQARLQRSGVTAVDLQSKCEETPAGNTGRGAQEGGQTFQGDLMGGSGAGRMGG